METTPALSTAQPDNPMALIHMSIRDGDVDVDKLERLMEMQERWQREEARKAFFDAMNRVQADAPVVVRDAHNPQTNSHYAKLESVSKALKPIYTAHGLSLAFGTDASPVEGCVRITCDVQHVQGHERSYFADIPLDIAGIKGSTNKTKVHATGSSYSYGQRYLTCLIFNITLANQDNDGNNPLDNVTEEQAIQLKEFADSLGGDISARFLTWLKVESFYNIPASRYVECMHELKRKQGELRGNNASR